MMKQLFLLLVSLSTLTIWAQAPEPCGTHISHEWMESFYNRDKSHLENHSRGGGLPTVEIPIIYHLLGDDNGNGYYEMTDLLRLHCDFQAAMDPGNLHFYIYDIRYIDNTSFFNGNSTNQLFQIYNEGSVLNVFIVDDMSGVCGYSYVPENHDGSGWSGPNRGGIMLQKGCLDVGSTTYTHEGGHYLNLPHTFYGWEGEDSPNNNAPAPNSIGGVQVERVNGSNCLNSGDGFCDTPPDYISDRWQCNNLPTFQDPLGVTFSVDEKNYMCYSSDVCAEYFSADQYAEMNAAPANHRSYLLDFAPPSYVPLELVSETTPDGVDYLSPSSIITLTWNDIPGADYYLLEVATGNFFNPMVSEVLTDNTYELTNLVAGLDYEWRVKPYNFNWVCTDFSEVARFSTSTFNISLNKDDVSCAEASNGTATVSFPSGGHSVFWSATDPVLNNMVSATNTANINNLPGGDYAVMVISNQTGDTSVVNFTIESADDIFVTFNQVGNTIETNVVGGQAPYTIIWGNGTSGPTLANPVEGENTLLLVDANGCQKNASFNFEGGTLVSIDDIEANLVALNLYPNPSKDILHIAVDADIIGQMPVALYSTSGQIVAKDVFEKNTTDDTFQMNVSNVANGIYFLQVELGGSIYTQRLVVLK